MILKRPGVVCVLSKKTLAFEVAHKAKVGWLVGEMQLFIGFFFVPPSKLVLLFVADCSSQLL